MRRSRSLIGVCIAGLAAALAWGGAARLHAESGDDGGFKPLFNGTDLSGWVGDSDLWRVEDGEIVGNTDNKKITTNSFLSTTAVYSDFTLRIKVKLRDGNSGIQFRSEQLPDYVVGGYQADIAEQTYFGMLYEERKRGILPYWNELSDEERKAIHGAAKLDDWNQYEITCQGDRVIMVLNGKTTLDMNDPEGARSGIIALQLHTGDPMEVRFKDIELKELAPRYKPDAMADPVDPAALLMPEADQTRSERLGLRGDRFRVPEGFVVEEVATNELTGSLINLTFDYKGRPVVAQESKGVAYLERPNAEGVFQRMRTFYDGVSTAMGLYFAASGDLLVQANGPNGPAFYQITDTDLDDEGDLLRLILKSDGGMGEHGPHAIQRGPDGFIYFQYGNHAKPLRPSAVESPLRETREDHLLPRYVDPRGHATKITAPGGTIHRFDDALQRHERVAGGLRNAYDFALDASGEIWTFDSDMEWDFGLPWFRPIRVAHMIPGGDYGWRTGSTKMPFYYIDTLPSVHNSGRGSPVGVCFYEHNVYPERYHGALFLGDWSRGRIRVLFPQKDGATFAGPAVDFVVGEPLNVTDLEVGPDGHLYFTTGGRGTVGGLYRVRHTGPSHIPMPILDTEAALRHPMPRAAWARHALETYRNEAGTRWETELTEWARRADAPAALRVRAMEYLQVHGPRPGVALLAALAEDASPEVRGMAVYLLGTHPFEAVRGALVPRVADADPAVARRACEALVRSGLDAALPLNSADPLVDALLAAMDHDDRFLRYAARLAVQRVRTEAWGTRALALDVAAQPRAAMESLLALVHTQQTPEDSDTVFTRLAAIDPAALSDDTLLAYLRVLQLAYLRDVRAGEGRAAFNDALAPALLARFPGPDYRVNRELQVVLAHMQRADAIAPMLAYLSPDKSQEEQIHTMYALRAIQSGWTPEQREAAVAWFDIGRELPGAASMEGFINNMWQSLLAGFPDEARAAAEARKAAALQRRQEDALALMQYDDADTQANTELAQMSFEELSDYLEYDPMAYRADMERGAQVFVRSKCASCHIFGTVGKGGGPDLSTVTSRFRRRDILESIMFPAKVVSDQYTGVELELDDFSTATGMLVGESTDVVTIITINGDRMEIPAESIVDRRTVHGSMMPEGLLGTMSLGDLVALINFLERGAELD